MSLRRLKFRPPIYSSKGRIALLLILFILFLNAIYHLNKTNYPEDIYTQNKVEDLVREKGIAKLCLNQY